MTEKVIKKIVIHLLSYICGDFQNDRKMNDYKPRIYSGVESELTE